MKKSICDRVLGLILILSMLIAGIGYDMACADSLFSVGSDTASVLMKVTYELETRAYYDETSMDVIENMNEGFVTVWQAVRGGNTGYSRVSYVLLFFLLLTVIYLLAVYNSNSLLFVLACLNQYGQRTLRYIHHKDGKKSIL
jgi:hypothetical protein